MSTPEDLEMERRLSALLHGRADQVEVVSDFTDPAVSRHRRNRRTRVIAGAAASVAALAIAVPVIFSKVGTSELNDRMVATPTVTTSMPSSTAGSSAPTTSSTTTRATPTASRPTATTNGPTATTNRPTATTPAAPSASVEATAAEWGAYAKDATIYTRWSTVPLGERTIQQFWPLANGNVLVWSTEPDDYGIYLLDRAGRQVGNAVSQDRVAVGTDRTSFASVTPSRITVRDSSGRALASRPSTDTQGVTRLVGLRGDWVWTSTDAASTAWNWRTGAVRQFAANLTAVNADGTLGAHVQAGGIDSTEGTCLWLTDLTTNTQRWRRCEASDPYGVTPLAFSRDDRTLLVDLNLDGGLYFGWGTVRVADGAPLLPTAGGTPTLVGWSITVTDEDRLLISANTSPQGSPATSGSLSSCTWAGECTVVMGSTVSAQPGSPYTRPNVVVGN